MTVALQQAAHPRRMRAGFQNDPGCGHLPEPLLQCVRAGPHTIFLDELSLLSQDTVAAPTIAEVHSNRTAHRVRCVQSLNCVWILFHCRSPWFEVWFLL